MAKRGTDFVDFTETGNWNVAMDYTKLKIMKPLYYLDLYETIATFGTTEMIEEFQYTENQINMNKIKALKRMTKELEILINNTIFALKKDDKLIIKGYREDLKKIKKVLPTIEITKRDVRSKRIEIEINEVAFNRILEMLINIKQEILEPLNKADLIFTSVEEFDPDRYKAEVLQDLIHGG